MNVRAPIGWLLLAGLPIAPSGTDASAQRPERLRRPAPLTRASASCVCATKACKRSTEKNGARQRGKGRARKGGGKRRCCFGPPLRGPPGRPPAFPNKPPATEQELITLEHNWSQA